LKRKRFRVSDREKLPQVWFEMPEVRRKKFQTAVWIPLRRVQQIEKRGKWGYAGYKEEFSGVGCVAFPLNLREKTSKLGWSDIGIAHGQGVWASAEGYKPAENFQHRLNEPFGIQLVLVQQFNDGPEEWHLNQDVMMALNLRRVGDEWIRPEEDYTIVVRMMRNSEGKAVSLEIKNEFLRDYLAARNMILRITAYHMRDMIETDDAHISWPNKNLIEKTDDALFEGRILKVPLGGGLGGSFFSMVVGRTDVDPEDDVPILGPETDSNVKIEARRGVTTGPDLSRIIGEYWHNETIEPASASPRIRRDKVVSGIEYIVDATGARLPSEDLNIEENARWLWFRPEVIAALSNRKGGELKWYTRETGGVSCSEGESTHFGINSSGLITVYAYDVAKLPVWQQRIWVAYNVTPEGKVSKELLSAQMEAKVATTFAPERVFSDMFDVLNDIFMHRVGAPLFCPHREAISILRSVHRFRALEPKGIYALAKDIIRLTADRINAEALKEIVPPPKGEKWNSIKSLEKYLATIIPSDDARKMMAPLVGVYKLRLADSHLPASSLQEAHEMAGVDPNAPALVQGSCMIVSVTRVFAEVANVLEDKI
jgi:hypothetical protein